MSAKCLSELRNRHAIAATAKRLLNRLKNLTRYEPNYPHAYEISTQALAAVATTWKDDSETLPWLKQLAQADEDSVVRFLAVQQLARVWKNDPKTLPWLKERAQPNEDSSVRFAAVQELASGWKDDPETLTILKKCAQAESSIVRFAAMQELASGWKDDPETLTILKKCAQADEDRGLRRAAVQELARVWKDEPGMFEFFDRAVNDPFERKQDWEDNPRQTALEVILEQYPDHPQTLPLLSDRADNDPDEKVREFAKKKLRERGVRK